MAKNKKQDQGIEHLFKIRATKVYKTPMPKSNCDKQWYIIDAKNKTLGRLATKISHFLRGKHKTCYAPHVDVGDHIIVVNASKVRVTGKKETDKFYYRHTGYPGGLKKTNLATMRSKSPNKIIMNAVKGMLPKNPLGRDMLRKLKVYANDQHPHSAQNPCEIDIAS